MTLNFVNADIEGVTRAMAAILRQQFVVDPRVRGTITLYSEEPLTPNEAYLNFLAALRGLGFTVVEVGGLFKVVPEADAKLQAGTVSIGENVPRRGDQVLTQIFRLNYENANTLVPVLRPLITPNNTINANPSNNTLVITDYADNLQRIAKIIAAMDVPASGDVEVIPLQYAVASDIAPLRAAPHRQPAHTPAGRARDDRRRRRSARASILVDSRSNSLIVRSPNPAKMAQIRGLIAKLDIAAAGRRGERQHLGRAPEERRRDASSRRCCARPSPRRPAMAAANGGGARLPTGIPTSVAAAGAPAGGADLGRRARRSRRRPAPSTGGFIQADPATNSLVITAPEPLYRQVRAMIDQLDARRAQVYIESLIVEVIGDNAADFGFQWQGLIGNNGDKNLGRRRHQLRQSPATTSCGLDRCRSRGHDRRRGGGGSASPKASTSASCATSAASYGLAAIARFLQSQTNTNIASTPNLVTLDNEEAKIVVGSNVPFVTGQFTNTGTALANPFQTIERKDVGITLRIKPQIGENGTIRMTIFQESSSLSSQVAPGTSNAGPSTNKRSIESNVVVDDGQIIVLGGLIEDRYTDNRSKVPLLGDIPYLGGALPQREPVEDAHQPDGLPAPGRDARRRQHATSSRSTATT